MSFLAPQFLWGLLALIPLIAAYLLKVRPRKKQTNAWFLWEKIFEEKNSSSLFSKMRNFLSLLLMLITLLLIILSLSQPSFSVNDNRDLIIIIDRSASMNANTDGNSSSRIEKAKSTAHNLVRSISPSQRASLAILDKELHFITHLSNNAHRLHQAIDSIQPSTIPLNENAVTNIIKTNNQNHSDPNSSHRIILITDGCGKFPKSYPELATDIEILNIAEDDTPENLGIIAADILPSPGSTTAECMVKIASSLTSPTKAEVELFHPATGSVGKLSEFTINPGINEPFFFNIPDAAPGEWIARILREDALAEDNSAQLILRPLPTIPVTIPTSDNYFYQRCIEAFSKSGGSLQIADPGQESSITLYHGTIPTDATGNIIIFAPTGSSPFWTTIGNEVIVNLAIAENSEHPILRHSDLNQISFPGAKQITPPENARIILESDQKIPLIFQINERDKSVIVVNLDPTQADFFLSPAFPVIIHDAATYLSGHDTQLTSVYPTGTTLNLTEPENPNSNSLNLDSPGTYDFPKKGLAHQVSAALLSADETLLASKIKSTPLTNLATGYPLSFWLIVLAIDILIIESILYHRRKAD
jgi:hypothetical protein